MENEKRLIDANALMDSFREYMVERYDKEKCVSEENCKTCDKPCLWRKIVRSAPTVEAVEVKHGRWRVSRESEISKTVWCTACGEEFYLHKKNTVHIDKMPYCPNCGAKMDGDGNV